MSKTSSKPITIDRDLQSALSALAAGRMGGAERLLKAMLRGQPNGLLCAKQEPADQRCFHRCDVAISAVRATAGHRGRERCTELAPRGNLVIRPPARLFPAPRKKADADEAATPGHLASRSLSVSDYRPSFSADFEETRARQAPKARCLSLKNIHVSRENFSSTSKNFAGRIRE
jgi:hypothetical protein